MTMPKMPKWAKARGLSQSEYNQYLTWMKSRYGWRTGSLTGEDSYYYDFFYIPAMEKGYTIGPTTAGAGIQFPWSKSVIPTPTDVAPTPTDVAPPKEPKRDMIWRIPNQLTQDKNTGIFYDAEGNWEIPQATAMDIINQYNLETSQGQGAVDWARQAAFQAQQVQAYLHQQPRPSDVMAQLAGRKQMAGDYETWRERLLAELTTPRDWITRWQVINQPNPYSVSAQEEQSAIVEERIGQLQWEMGSLQSEQPNPLLTRTVEQAQAELEALEAEQAGAGAYGEQLQVIAERSARLNRPSGPPAPGWLSQFVPGQVAGQPITKQRTTIPSGQQWARTPWSQREGLAGYTEWAGYSPYQDMLEQMAMMQPSSPNIAYQWRPPSQRR